MYALRQRSGVFRRRQQTSPPVDDDVNNALRHRGSHNRDTCSHRLQDHRRQALRLIGRWTHKDAQLLVERLHLGDVASEAIEKELTETEEKTLKDLNDFDFDGL